jgi:hypothetical protein
MKSGAVMENAEHFRVAGRTERRLRVGGRGRSVQGGRVFA